MMAGNSEKPVRLLALDGGGVRGYSELLILENIMRRVQKYEERPTDDVPKPADYFDIIAGTSTGGLIALMLGRLGMSLKEAIAAYEDLCPQLFGRKEGRVRRMIKSAKYSDENFTETLQTMIGQKLKDNDAKLYEPEMKCKVFVCAICTNNVESARRLKSWEKASHADYDWSIWEAARATTAAPGYYTEIEVGRKGSEEKFVDAGLGCNNPAQELHEEAELLFDPSRDLACFLSLGTGIKTVNEIREPTLKDKIIPENIIRSIKNLATDSERVAKNLEKRYVGMDGLYFRFSVERGLERVKLDHYEKLGLIKSSTENYLKEPRIEAQLDKVARILAGVSEPMYQVVVLSSSIRKIQQAAGTKEETLGGISRRWSFAETESQQTAVTQHPPDPFSKQSRELGAGYQFCTWFLGRDEFKKLCNPTYPFVWWVAGMSGYGKSVFALAVIHQLTTARDNANCLVLFYNCQKGSQKPAYTDMLKGLISQSLSWQKESAVANSPQVRRALSKMNGADDTIDSALLQLLVEIIASVGEKVCIVIDGLESSSIDRYTLSDMVSALLNGSGIAKTSILLTSQGQGSEVLKNLAGNLQNHQSHFEITPEDTAEDLRCWVEHQINDHKSELRDLDPKTKNEVILSVSERANGMFLHASLLLNELKGEVIMFPDELKATLQRLPGSLHLTYKGYFENSIHTTRGREICCWVFASLEPLTWNEIRTGLAIKDDKFEPGNLISDSFSCANALEKMCAPVVESYGQNNILRFMSPSVRDFLSEESDLTEEIGILDAHSMIARKLLVMLQLDDVPDLSREDHGDLTESIKRYSKQSGRWLYPYATLNWYKHLKLSVKPGLPNADGGQLEEAVFNFLYSENSLKWLVAAVFMLKYHDGGHISSTALSNEVIDCLSVWLGARRSTEEGSRKLEIERWTRDFLNLMIDWGRAIERDPRHIYAIHLDLLPEQHIFRGFLKKRAIQSVILFNNRRPFTRSCQKASWVQDVFATDSKGKIAYAFQGNYLRSFLISTGLLVAERVFGTETVRCVSARLSPDDRFIALLLENIPESEWEILESVKPIRDGLQLSTLNTTSSPVKWQLENDHDQNETRKIAEELQFPRGKYFVHVVSLNHYGLSSKKMFTPLPGKPSTLIRGYTKSIVWHLDEPVILNFSPGCDSLATTNGTLNLENGEFATRKHGDPRAQPGAKMTQDCQKVVFMQHRSIMKLYNVRDATSSEFSLPGIGHTLAVSDHGRYLLYLKVQALRSVPSRSAETHLPPQRGTISIHDFHRGLSTDLLILDPPFSEKHDPWKLHECIIPASFSPEDSEHLQVLLYAPRGWILAENVVNRYGLEQDIEDEEILYSSHLMVFDRDPLSFGSGFGSNPLIRSVIEYTDDRKMEASPQSPFSKLLTWCDDDFQTASLTRDGKMTLIKIRDLQETIQDLPNELEWVSKNQALNVVHSHIILSPDRKTIYRIQMTTNGSELQSAQEDSKLNLSDCHLVLEAVRRNGRLHQWNGVADRAIVSEQLHSDLRCVSVTNEYRISIGEVDIQMNFEKRGMAVISIDKEGIGVRAKKAFQKLLKRQPFQPEPEEKTSTGGPGRRLYNQHAVLCSFCRSFRLFSEEDSVEESLGRLRADEHKGVLAMGSYAGQKGLHLYQFAKLSHPGTVVRDRRRQPRVFEVSLCIFNEEKNRITWMANTHTGGYVEQSEHSVPQASWALHPRMPILAWVIPGHKLRISWTESHKSPLCVYEPLTLEVETSQALRFSPGGRYLLVLARETVGPRPDSEVARSRRRNVMVFDLQGGKIYSISLLSHVSLSIDIDDEYLRTYRLNRGDAIEMERYTLPELVESERFYLTSIPADCCCNTCGQPLYPNCNILGVGTDQAKSLVLCHGTLHHERAVLRNKACEPIILHIGHPTKLNDSEPMKSLVVDRDELRIPIIFDADGGIRNGAFDNSSHLRDCPCYPCSPGNVEEILQDNTTDAVFDEGQTARVHAPQSKTDDEKPDQDKSSNGATALETVKKHAIIENQSIHDFTTTVIRIGDRLQKEFLIGPGEIPIPGSSYPPTKGATEPDAKTSKGLEEQTPGDYSIPRATTQMVPIFDNSRIFKLGDGVTPIKSRQLGYMSALFTAAFEVDASFRLSFSPKDNLGEVEFDEIKHSAEELGKPLPYDNWEEFSTALSEFEELDIYELLDQITKQGDPNNICRIPQIVHTFLFTERQDWKDTEGSCDFQIRGLEWSSAYDVGWIEEDSAWTLIRAFFSKERGRIRHSYYAWRYDQSSKPTPKIGSAAEASEEEPMDTIQEQFEGFADKESNVQARNLFDKMSQSHHLANKEQTQLNYIETFDRRLRLRFYQTFEVEPSLNA